MKPGFIMLPGRNTPLSAEWNGKRYTLLEPLVFIRPSGERVTVNPGFKYDGDSVPRIPFAYAWLKGRAQASACLHDWGYAAQMGKAWADDLFYEAMPLDVEPVTGLRRWSIYQAVSWFGGKAYRSHSSGPYAHHGLISS